MGLEVRSFDPGRYLLAGDAEEGVWCLALAPVEGGTRLIGRWRLNRKLTPANAFFMLLSDPGAFIMERKMLKGIKARVERAPRNSEESGLYGIGGPSQSPPGGRRSGLLCS